MIGYKMMTKNHKNHPQAHKIKLFKRKRSFKIKNKKNNNILTMIKFNMFNK